MAGNVWEWTRSRSGDYPYPADGTREDLAEEDVLRVVVRGGSFLHYLWAARCAYRGWSPPNNRYWYYGFRVVCAPFLQSL